MTIANDIISCRVPDFDFYLREGESLDDIDEYGFTPLIESAITRQPNIAKLLIDRKVDINKPDVTGRTALHWAVDNADLELIRLLLANGADANAYTRAGLSVLVYPILRSQNEIKHLLYQFNAKLDFALDFIYTKLLGHRFELKGDVDIINAEGEFIELDYEGFILEFTVAVIKDSLRRFTSSYSTRHFRSQFNYIHTIMDAFNVADELLQMQHHPNLSSQDIAKLKNLIESPMMILPAASRGHALCFVKYNEWWAKIDRGENSLHEGSINIYRITKSKAFSLNFIRDFLYRKQPREYFHKAINQELGLEPVLHIPMSSQIVGNCSWANVQASVAVGYALQQITDVNSFSYAESLQIYDNWMEWDKDRALDECIQRFYTADASRKASIASMLGAVLFQVCDERNSLHIARAERILTILTLPECYYILQTYLDTYCIQRLTRKGNNLLKLLDDCGINPNIGVNPIATGLDDKRS
ncbi:MAG: ankyrin repeat domain-containing protein [Legionellaceae bacterium]|nr:ankyrin repeat domain-containing protein [Legionellaceae bacterium]